MPKIEFIIDWVDPVPKGRPRFSGGHVFTPKKTLDYEKLVARAVMECNQAAFSGPVQVEMHFVLRTHRRADVDNLAKSVMDGCNGYAFEDDTQVCRITATKKHGKTPSTHVIISPLEDDGVWHYTDK